MEKLQEEKDKRAAWLDVIVAMTNYLDKYGSIEILGPLGEFMVEFESAKDLTFIEHGVIELTQ